MAFHKRSTTGKVNFASEHCLVCKTLYILVVVLLYCSLSLLTESGLDSVSSTFSRKHTGP